MEGTNIPDLSKLLGNDSDPAKDPGANRFLFGTDNIAAPKVRDPKNPTQEELDQFTELSIGLAPPNDLKSKNEGIDEISDILDFRPIEDASEILVESPFKAFQPKPIEEVPQIDKNVSPPIDSLEATSIVEDPSSPLVGSDLVAQLIVHEGLRTKVYKDSVGIPTIGVGFNLTRSDAREKLAERGYNIDDVLKGQEIDRDTIISLLKDTIIEAKEAVKRQVSNFDNLSIKRQRALVDLMFNMGEGTFNREKFSSTIPAIEAENWTLVANLLRNTKWYRQVKSRGPRVVMMLEFDALPDFNTDFKESSLLARK